MNQMRGGLLSMAVSEQATPLITIPSPITAAQPLWALNQGEVTP